MKKVLSWFALSLSSGLFTGFLGVRGVGGGFFGSLIGLTVAAAIMVYGGGLPIALVAVTVCFLLGMATVDMGEELLRSWGSRARHNGKLVTHDFNETNIDEVFGQLVACLPIFMVALPHGQQTFLFVAAFVLFRVFDAFKPGLIGLVEEHYDGTAFGIMIDDGVAGVTAAIGVGLLILVLKIINLGLAINAAWSGLPG